MVSMAIPKHSSKKLAGTPLLARLRNDAVRVCQVETHRYRRSQHRSRFPKFVAKQTCRGIGQTAAFD